MEPAQTQARGCQGQVIIALVHASARPEKWKAARDRYLNKAANPHRVRHWLCFDLRQQRAFAESCVDAPTLWIINDDRPDATTATNVCARAALASNSDLLVLVCDDMDAPLNWDDELVQRVPDFSKPCVLHVSTGLKNNDDDGLISHPICTAAYARLDAYFFYPEYPSVWADADWSAVANSRRCVIRCPDLMFRHLHHSVGLNQMDDVYRAHDNNDRYLRGKAIFEKRRAAGFK